MFLTLVCCAVGLVFEQRATHVKEAASGDSRRDFDSWWQLDLRMYALIDQVYPVHCCEALRETNWSEAAEAGRERLR
jgi:hypothetical protein